MKTILILSMVSASALLAAPAAYEGDGAVRAENAAVSVQPLRAAAGMSPRALLSAEVFDAEGRTAGRIEHLDLSDDGRADTIWLSLTGGGTGWLALPIERLAYEPDTGRLVADAGLERMLEWAAKDAAEGTANASALDAALTAAAEMDPARHS